MTTITGSKLKYHGSTTEVRLGDRVEVRGWFGVKYRGYVSYIPGISEKRRELEYEDVRQWAITSDDGTTYPILYDPVNFQPPKHIRFIQHTENKGTLPNEELT